MSGNAFSCVIGDSHTNNTATGNLYGEFFPAVAQKVLNASSNPNLRIRNLGKSGDTSATIVGRMSGIFQFEVPRFVGIYIGTNDSLAGNQSTVQASPTPTTTAFAVAAGRGALVSTFGSWIKVGAQTSVQVVGISGDTLTVYPALGSTPVAGDAVVMDTQRNIQEVGNYCKSRGCSNLVVCLQHYLNYSGGDTVGTPLALDVTLRAAQQAAATTLGASVADFFTPLSARIQAGTDRQNYTQTLIVTSIGPHAFTITGGTGVNYASGQSIVVDGRLTVIDKVVGDLIRLAAPLRFTPPVSGIVTGNWHVADQNTHLNAYGNSLLGAIFASTISSASWAGSLS